jgi:hypothetical protein
MPSTLPRSRCAASRLSLVYLCCVSARVFVCVWLQGCLSVVSFSLVTSLALCAAWRDTCSSVSDHHS